MSDLFVKLGSCVKQYRNEVWVDDSKNYGQVTVSGTGTISHRGTKFGGNIGRKRQFVLDLKTYPNTLIFTRQGIYDGAIGFAPPDTDGCIATENMPMFSLNSGISREYMEQLLLSSVFKNEVRKLAPKGAAQKSIHERELLEVRVPIPSLDKQIAIANSVAEKRETIGTVQRELTHQETLLGQLQQAILQEAIAGKLTADWRAAHPQAEPARQLLHRIQAEKARLIAAKQLRPEKPLPTITPAEIPFAIPKTWEWCRIANATLVIVDCPHSTPQWTDSGMNCAKTNQFNRFHLDLSQRYYVSKQTYQERVERLVPKPGDILYSREGSILGIACRIPDGEELCLGQRMMLLRPHHPTSAAFLELMLNSPHVTKIADESTLGGCSPHINVGEIKSFVIPLPPLAEQAAIVARVATLLGSSRLLAQELAASRTHAAHLLQAVLKSAFTPATK